MFKLLMNILHLLRLAAYVIFSGILFRLLSLAINLLFNRDTTLAMQKLGVALHNLLQTMGPTFIKLGQVLSTRSDIIGDILAQSLSTLQDGVPPFAFKQVNKTIAKELGADINSLFKDFSEQPIAAASIAQVHKATTYDGDVVAVKVLRPGIEHIFIRDIRLFAWLANVISFIFPKFKRYKLHEVVQDFAKQVDMETDLRLEAAAAEKLRLNCADDHNVYIPHIFWQLTSKRVMVQEWIDAIPIYNKESLLKAGIDLHELIKNLAISFFNQAYRDGFFHADIHPGNILVDKKGKIILIDFGIIGYLEPRDRIFVAKVLYGFITKDYQMVTDVHFDLGFVPANQSREMFKLACMSVGEPIIGMPVNRISLARLLKQLFEISEKFDMNIQPKFLLLQKTLMTIEGTGFALYPEVNMWKLAEPWIREWAEETFGLRAKIYEYRDTIVKFANALPEIAANIKEINHKLSTPKQSQKNVPKWKLLLGGGAFFVLGLVAGLYF